MDLDIIGSGISNFWHWFFFFFFFLQNSLTLTARHWKIFKGVEFPCLTLLTLEWSSKIHIRSYGALHISVCKEHHCLTEWWEKLLSGVATSPLSHTACAAPSSANSMGRGVRSSYVLANLPLYTELHGWEGLGQTTLAFIHGSAPEPKNLHNLLHFYLVPCNSCSGGVVPWVTKQLHALMFSESSPLFHARSWPGIIHCLGRWPFNGCHNQSKCWIGFSVLSLMWQQSLASNCVSPLFRSQLPWVDSSLHPGTTANYIETKST